MPIEIDIREPCERANNFPLHDGLGSLDQPVQGPISYLAGRGLLAIAALHRKASLDGPERRITRGALGKPMDCSWRPGRIPAFTPQRGKGMARLKSIAGRLWDQ